MMLAAMVCWIFLTEHYGKRVAVNVASVDAVEASAFGNEPRTVVYFRGEHVTVRESLDQVLAAIRQPVCS